MRSRGCRCILTARSRRQPAHSNWPTSLTMNPSDARLETARRVTAGIRLQTRPQRADEGCTRVGVHRVAMACRLASRTVRPGHVLCARRDLPVMSVACCSATAPGKPGSAPRETPARCIGLRKGATPDAPRPGTRGPSSSALRESRSLFSPRIEAISPRSGLDAMKQLDRRCRAPRNHPLGLVCRSYADT
jgi:hypothetical protein